MGTCIESRAAMKPRILFVDDEANVLNGIRRGLRHMSNTWNLMFAESGAAAFDLMAIKAADVIVTDMQMPGFGGDLVLDHVSRLYPETQCIVLTGECGRLESYLRSNTDFHYLEKPCDLQLLTVSIERALSRQHPHVFHSIQDISPQDTQTLLLLIAQKLLDHGLLSDHELPASIDRALADRFGRFIDFGAIDDSYLP